MTALLAGSFHSLLRSGAFLLAFFTALLVGSAAKGTSTMRTTTVYEHVDAPDVLSIHSKSFAPGGRISDENTGAGAGLSPPLSFADIPPSARSLVLLVEDPDAPGKTPYVHWLVYDLPADTKSLPAGLPDEGRLEHPQGALQGRTSAKTVGYTPPHPPRHDPPHAYHFELFALNTATLALPEGATREQVIAAAMPHIVAKGRIIGTFGWR